MKVDLREHASGLGDGFPVLGSSPPSVFPESAECDSEGTAAVPGVLEQAPPRWQEVADAIWLAVGWDRHSGLAGTAPQAPGRDGPRPAADSSDAADGARPLRPDLTGDAAPASLKPGSLAAWADLVTEERGARRPLPVLLAGTLTKGAPAPGLHAPRFPHAAKAAVRRFFTLATPAARRLATQLAATPFDFDLVEQLRRRTMPQTGPDHLAEILMVGLINWDGGGSGRPEFADGIREELLATTRSQPAHTIRVVGEVPAAGERGVALGAAPRGPVGARLPDPEERGWARSELAVIHALSGPYSERAKRIEPGLWGPVSAAVEHVSSGLAAGTPTDVKPVGVGASPGDPVASDPASNEPDESGVPVPLVTDAIQPEALEAEPLMPNTTTTALPVNVPLRNTSFVGQQALVRAVEQQLASQDTAAVLPHAAHGLGGVTFGRQKSIRLLQKRSTDLTDRGRRPARRAPRQPAVRGRTAQTGVRSTHFEEAVMTTPK